MTLAARTARLAAVFEHIAATRMAGVGLLHPGLRVQAVGFAAQDDEAVALGVLVTPWFMNLVRLPLKAGAGEIAAPFENATRAVGVHRIEFLGADEPGLGRFEACSLYSPMSAFANQAAAVATAIEVLVQLRAAPPSAPADPASQRTLLDRRGLLFGRRAVQAR